MPLQFTQEEVESELSDKIPHGRRKKIAIAAGWKQSTLDRQLNPNDEAASCFFRTLQIICAYDDVDEQEADALWQTFIQFRELSRRRKSADRKTCVNGRAASLNTDVAELIASRLRGEPFVRQMKELLDVRRTIDSLQEDLIGEYQQENEPVRGTVAPIVGRK